MYRSPDYNYPGLKFLHEKNFIQQIDYFEKAFGFIKKQDWIDSFNNKNRDKNLKGIILTFDDGLACHYNSV